MPSVHAAAVNAVIRFEASVDQTIELSKYPAYSVYSEPQRNASEPSKTLLPDPVIKEEDMILKSTTITFILVALMVASAMTVALDQAAGNPAELLHPCCSGQTQQPDESSDASQASRSGQANQPGQALEVVEKALPSYEGHAREGQAGEEHAGGEQSGGQESGVPVILPLSAADGGLQAPRPAARGIQLNEMDEEMLREINRIRMRLGGGIAGHLQSLPHHMQDLDAQNLSAGSTVEPAPAAVDSGPQAPASTSMERLRDPYGLREITEDEPVDPWEQLFEQQMRSLIAAELAAGGSAAAGPATEAAGSATEMEYADMAGVDRAPAGLSHAPATSDPIEVQRIRDVARDLDDSAADLEELEQYSAADQLREMARKLRERVRHADSHGAIHRR